MEINEQAQRAMKSAYSVLICNEPFFASLLFKLECVQTSRYPRAATNGKTLYYNPEWWLSITANERKGVLCHEVMHCANGHCWRMGARERKKWNISADAVINPMIKVAGMALPEGCVFIPNTDGMSVEAVYNMLPDSIVDQYDCGGDSYYVDVLPADAEGLTEDEWKEALVNAANIAQQQGKLPSGMDRFINSARIPACRNLTAALLEFCNRTARNDYSMKKPNRRMIGSGMYLPSLISTECPPISAVVDTSGSVDDELLTVYCGALQAVLDDVSPEILSVYSCDSDVHSRAEYVVGDIVIGKFPGGGGTDFRPGIKSASEDEPCACIYFTDMYGAFPETPPPFPVLWVIKDVRGERQSAPFGECVYID